MQRGKRYRFRAVNAGSHVCPALIEIQSHSLQIIASDGFSLQPVIVDSLYLNAGERFDFVVNANQTGGELEDFIQSFVYKF